MWGIDKLKKMSFRHLFVLGKIAKKTNENVFIKKYKTILQQLLIISN